MLQVLVETPSSSARVDSKHVDLSPESTSPGTTSTARPACPRRRQRDIHVFCSFCGNLQKSNRSLMYRGELVGKVLSCKLLCLKQTGQWVEGVCVKKRDLEMVG